MVELGSTSITIVSVIAAVAVASLLIAVVLRRQVLAAGEGTESMREIARAVQEGASAYLSRQFRTLALFAVVVCALLFLLPGDSGVKIGRSVLLPDRRRVLRGDRVPGHVAGHAGERPGGGGRVARPVGARRARASRSGPAGSSA